jgi:hypothetical protein
MGLFDRFKKAPSKATQVSSPQKNVTHTKMTPKEMSACLAAGRTVVLNIGALPEFGYEILGHKVRCYDCGSQYQDRLLSHIAMISGYKQVTRMNPHPYVTALLEGKCPMCGGSEVTIAP